MEYTLTHWQVLWETLSTEFNDHYAYVPLSNLLRSANIHLTPIRQSIQQISKSIYIPRGINTEALDRSIGWDFTPTRIKAGIYPIANDIQDLTLHTGGRSYHRWRHLRRGIRELSCRQAQDYAVATRDGYRDAHCGEGQLCGGRMSMGCQLCLRFF